MIGFLSFIARNEKDTLSKENIKPNKSEYMDMIHKYVAVITTSILLSTPVFASLTQEQVDEIDKRTAPVGGVYIKSDAPAEPKVAAAPRTGEDVYKTYCTLCHGTGLSGAPKTGNAQEWQPRLEKGMDTLKEHALNGFNAMPAMGTCGDCSSDELVAAIEFMTKDI